ncbi:hypothetical protein DNK59_10500 [Pseudomonas sp. TKO26]|uniref:hypothetical protein n=1 Tax=unclassified Pseudomonas TaxID=196821 RepID=UPI000D85077D|nr:MULTISPECIES: hypothetical protein [unclassified Pseudomonas]PYY88076.1 hypothetical protein DNK62_10500 [Pseudomonas sp. TKO30]PYY91059.1 hypothetical protein DNK61_10495 [Pseudomonas sp. TKO29]PYY93933.1 hypothetical protein DNK59_10500 [Pseudomonas sp. TKO26]PYZ00662.1 hypothetical protein DNK60_10495 [Pseudomonas sp. TKO14]
MKLSINQIKNANLAWIHQVFVVAGDANPVGTTEYYKLQIREVSSAIKESRIEDITLKIQVDVINEDVLDSIKQLLVNNTTISEPVEVISAAVWLPVKMTITPR